MGMMVGMDAPEPLTMGQWIQIDFAIFDPAKRSRRSRENSRMRRDFGRMKRRIVGVGCIRIEGQIMPGVIETPGNAQVEYPGQPMGFIYVPEGET